MHKTKKSLSESYAAVVNSKQELDRIRKSHEQVSELMQDFRHIRQKNHFADKLKLAFGKE